MLCEIWLSVGTILCGTIQFDKEVEISNFFDNISERWDELVDDNNNWCWREKRVWWSIVKYMKALGDIIFAREK